MFSWKWSEGNQGGTSNIHQCTQRLNAKTQVNYVWIFLVNFSIHIYFWFYLFRKRKLCDIVLIKMINSKPMWDIEHSPVYPKTQSQNTGKLFLNISCKLFYTYLFLILGFQKKKICDIVVMKMIRKKPRWNKAHSPLYPKTQNQNTGKLCLNISRKLFCIYLHCITLYYA